ncbi:hypothetical protein [Synechococcus sp. EJ6-Ellesmere]|uniref:hypothetical protein n=1 Tax=Synechococcus sp. EJ6-Ellesmere TaxID=2823734 RepID=UPI0020CE1C8A|nr:hypothetical protein [Synechococcus sp. EJ6-Ellesmere]MCP9824498.1 hypothetical protein [Synechococcus sp. EJ6-Ellesmere]
MNMLIDLLARLLLLLPNWCAPWFPDPVLWRAIALIHGEEEAAIAQARMALRLREMREAVDAMEQEADRR